MTSVVTGALLALLTNRTLVVKMAMEPGDHGYFDLEDLIQFCFPWRSALRVEELGLCP